MIESLTWEKVKGVYASVNAAQQILGFPLPTHMVQFYPQARPDYPYVTCDYVFDLDSIFVCAISENSTTCERIELAGQRGIENLKQNIIDAVEIVLKKLQELP